MARPNPDTSYVESPEGRIRALLLPFLDARVRVKRAVLELESGHELVLEPDTGRVALRRRPRGVVDPGLSFLVLGALKDYAAQAGVPLALEEQWSRAVVCRIGAVATQRKAVGE